MPRTVAGVPVTVGRRIDTRAGAFLSRRELEHLRCGVHDFYADRGMKVTRMEKPQFGKATRTGPSVQTFRPWRQWVTRVPASLRRIGNLPDAARMAGARLRDVEHELERNPVFAHACEEALAQYSARQAERAARKRERLDGGNGHEQSHEHELAAA